MESYITAALNLAMALWFVWHLEKAYRRNEHLVRENEGLRVELKAVDRMIDDLK